MSPLRIRLRALRDALGWSQQELSDRSGVRQATISELESGKARRADFTTLERLAKALNVTPGAMFEMDEAPTASRKKRR